MLAPYSLQSIDQLLNELEELGAYPNARSAVLDGLVRTVGVSQ